MWGLRANLVDTTKSVAFLRRTGAFTGRAGGHADSCAAQVPGEHARPRKRIPQRGSARQAHADPKITHRVLDLAMAEKDRRPTSRTCHATWSVAIWAFVSKRSVPGRMAGSMDGTPRRRPASPKVHQIRSQPVHQVAVGHAGPGARTRCAGVSPALMSQ